MLFAELHFYHKSENIYQRLLQHLNYLGVCCLLTSPISYDMVGFWEKNNIDMIIKLLIQS